MGTWTKRASGLPAILVAAGVPAAVIFLLNPLQIAWSNLQDMEAPIGALAVGALIAMLVAFLLGASMLWGLEKIGFRRAVPLAMAAGFMFWLHSAVLVWDYGVLDGTNIDWRAHRIAGVMELLLWIGLLTWAAMRPQIVRRVGLRVLPALLSIQFVSVGMTAVSAPEAPSFHTYSLGTENQHLFSKNRNVIFLVLDAFQADVFAEVAAENPELAEQFEGFTYYRNAVSGFSKTYPSPALMFTGQYYENKEPLHQFLERVYMHDSVPTELVEAGWDVGMYPYVSRTLHFDPAIASNVHKALVSDADLVETAKLLDVSLFRAVPHYMKPLIANDQRWLFRQVAGAVTRRMAAARKQDDSTIWRSSHRHPDMRFIEELEHNGRVETDRPVFRYFHLYAPHAPFMLNENLEMELLDEGRGGYVEYSKASVKIVGRILDALRELEVYDDAAIFIVSDHGGGEYASGIATEYAGRDIQNDEAGGIGSFEHASGLPLMLLKKSGDSGSLKVSDAPVSLADVAATLDALTIRSGTYPGEPVHEVEEGEQRVRRYLFYKFEGWNADYLPTLNEYLVKGFSWDAVSWRNTGRTFEGETPPEGEMDIGPASVVPGERYSTAIDGNGLAFIGKGWWEAEKDFTWSRGGQSELTLNFEKKVAGDIVVTLEMMPYLGRGYLDHQQVIVRYEGKVRGEFELTRHGHYSVAIPLGTEGAKSVDLVLEVPGAISPAKALSGTDQRTLGIAFYGFKVDMPSAVDSGYALEFGVGKEGTGALREGWARPEMTFTWTAAEEASLQLSLAWSLQGKRVPLVFSLRPFLAPPDLKSQHVDVIVDGKEVTEWVLDEGGKYPVTLPGDATRDGLVEITFELPDATIPAMVSENEDMRLLGIALYEIEVGGDIE